MKKTSMYALVGIIILIAAFITCKNNVEDKKTIRLYPK